MLGRGIVYIIASTLCVTFFTGCGKAGNAISEAAKYAEIDKEQTYELEKMDGIISEGEIIITMDYINGKVRALSVIDGKKGRCISFNTDGTDVQSFNIDSDKEFRPENPIFDDEGNLYIKAYELSHTEGEDDSEGASSESKIYLIKFDPTGKELYRTDLSEKFSDTAEYVKILMHSKKYGLILLANQGIMTYDETNGYNKIKPKFISDPGGIIKLSDTQFLLEYDLGGLLELFDLDTKEVKRNLNKGWRDNTSYDFFWSNEIIIGEKQIKEKIKEINNYFIDKKNPIFYMLEIEIKSIKNTEFLNKFDFLDVPGLNESV